MYVCMHVFLCKCHIITANLNYAASLSSQSELAEATYLLLANGPYIHQISLDGSRLRTIISEPTHRIYALDYHVR